MPLYDFMCTKCCKVFEARTSADRTDKQKCPHCGAQAVLKWRSAPARIWKGGTPE